jgi:hypothetical protein
MRSLMLALLAISLVGCAKDGAARRAMDGGEAPETREPEFHRPLEHVIVYVECTSDSDTPMNFPESAIQYKCL